jgi:hypothetical protein
LITSSQIFTTTTDANGDAFNITSSCCTHCFNLPTASATQVGALSCQDWGIFNSKQSTTYPPQSFYVNPTNAIASAITCPYSFCSRQCLDTTVTFVPSAGGTITLTAPNKAAQSGEYTIMRMGSMVYYCFSFCWSASQGGSISAASSANNITMCFLNPSNVPLPCTTNNLTGNGTFQGALGEIYFSVDEFLGGYFGKSIFVPAVTSINNVFQRVGITCCFQSGQPITFTRAIFQAPYPSTFNYMSGFIVYQGKP